MKRLLFLFLALLFLMPAEAQTPAEITPITPEKRAEIEKMLRLTGMEKLMDQMKNQMLTQLQSGTPSVPADFWKKFSDQMDMSELIEIIIPIYDKYYTLEDLRAVNTFYSSATGQKILTTLPQLMQESMAAGQKWGEKIGKKAVDEIAAEAKAKPKSS